MIMLLKYFDDRLIIVVIFAATRESFSAEYA